MSEAEWRLTPMDQRFAHIMIGGEMPRRAFWSSLGTHEQREAALRRWMADEGITELVRPDDPITGDILLRAVRPGGMPAQEARE